MGRKPARGPFPRTPTPSRPHREGSFHECRGGVLTGRTPQLVLYRRLSKSPPIRVILQFRLGLLSRSTTRLFCHTCQTQVRQLLQRVLPRAHRPTPQSHPTTTSRIQTQRRIKAARFGKPSVEEAAPDESVPERLPKRARADPKPAEPPRYLFLVRVIGPVPRWQPQLRPYGLQGLRQVKLLRSRRHRQRRRSQNLVPQQRPQRPLLQARRGKHCSPRLHSHSI